MSEQGIPLRQGLTVRPWLGTCPLDQAGLRFVGLLSSAFQVLGLGGTHHHARLFYAVFRHAFTM